ncbi:MAG: glycosyltransferase family 9 protein [Rhodospirillales bacterium]
MSDSAVRHVLIIKLGALGDFVQALGPMAAIRRHHPDAHITLLTAKPYADLAKASGSVDDIWIDTRPAWWQIGGWLDLRYWLRRTGFDWVYDLQTSDRSGFYYRLFWPGPYPKFSGIAEGCSHPHTNPGRDLLHTVERQREQLKAAGIDNVPETDLSSAVWARADVSFLNLPERYALLVPGGAAHRPGKRWPAEYYGALAAMLAARGVTPVLLGAKGEKDVLANIHAACPQALDLCGRTDFLQIVALARGAVCAVGNDTGPMHLIAAAGCPSVVLYSFESDPVLCAQRGPDVAILRRETLADLTPETVFSELQARISALA